MPRKVLGSWWKGAFPCRFPAVIFPFGDDRYEKISCRLLAGPDGLDGRLRLRFNVKLLHPQRISRPDRFRFRRHSRECPGSRPDHGRADGLLLRV